MRIGIDVKTLSRRYTGIAVYVHEMIRFFNEQKVEDEFYLFSPKDFELDFPLGDNIHKIIYPSINGSISVLFCLSKLLNRYQIDVFWGPEHIVPLSRCSCKKIVTIHDLAAMMNPNLGTIFNTILNKLFVLPSIRKSDGIIAISQSTAADVVRLSGIERSKITVIYNGDSPYKYKLTELSIDVYNSIKDKFHLIRDYFLYVGTIEPRKNIPTIIEGYNTYRDNGGKKLLVLAGGLGWKYKKSLRSIKKSPYYEDIILTGYCSNEEKELLYKNATALLFPSLYEGFGLPILEAMSIGTPVITTNVSSMPEVGGDAVFYINSVEDYTSLANIMKSIEDFGTEELEIIRNRGFARSQLFSRKKCAEEILKLFHDL